MAKIRILVIDDHSLFRETLTFMMNEDGRFQVIGETNNADIAFTLAKEKKPDIILMDLSMSPVDGFMLTERMLAYSSRFRIIAISMHALLGYARRIFQLGASGYVTKSSGMQELFKGIIEVQKGGKYVCQEIKDAFVDKELESIATGMTILSNRELDITKLIKEGLSSKDIGAKLEITTKTVEAHRYNILKKLNLKNTVALVNFTNLHGL